MVLVDTSVWSLALRRRPEHLSPREQLLVAEWSELVREGRVQMIGPIRQELLSGLRHKQQFALLEERLSVFPDTPIETADYLEAARFFNLLQAGGVTGDSHRLVDLRGCPPARMGHLYVGRGFRTVRANSSNPLAPSALRQTLAVKDLALYCRHEVPRGLRV